MTRFWWILIRALKIHENLHFDWVISCKANNIWPKNVQRSYLSWHWNAMQNLKKNWLVVWKMSWGILEIFTRTLGSVIIETLMGSFYPRQKMHELKHCRVVVCNDTEEWWKIWRSIDLSFQNRHKEFDEFWLEHSKV